MTNSNNCKKQGTIQQQINPWCVLLLGIIGVISGCASGGGNMTVAESACPGVPGASRKQPPQEVLNNVDDLLTVDCLLPGQLIQMGMYTTWMSPPRPAIISAWECKVQGGQYAIGATSDARQMAVNVWQKCADQGDKVAQNYLGEIYARSWEHIKPDFSQAIVWFRKAANQGYSRAQKNLGALYEQGLGVPKNPETAFKLYHQAIGPIAPVNIDPSTKEKIQDLSLRLDTSDQKTKALEGNQAQAKELQAIRSDNQKLREQLGKAKTHAALGVRPYMGQYYALIIGINSYQASLDSLKTPVSDAKQVEAILREKYGFKTTLLTDDTSIKPTRGGIFSVLEDLKSKLTKNDNLLIYYAGHGDISDNRYHWLPQDADSKNDANWISLDDIKKKIDTPPMSAKRVLIVADSCYPAGIIASVINAIPMATASTRFPLLASRSPATKIITAFAPFAPPSGGVPNLADASPEAQVAWIKAKSENFSRTALTSGQLEPVLDVDSGNGLSIFANAFLDALRKNDDVISAEQVYLEISPVVFAKVKKMSKNQMPAYGAIPNTGHNFGEFFFVPSAQNGNLQDGNHQIAMAVRE
jgi:Caspase domain/Sel1 repeat